MRYSVFKEEIPRDIVAELSAHSPLLRTLLYRRGIVTNSEAEKFLNPDYERDTHDPFLMLHMERAVERILRAIKNDERIIVYGDYDCDGIPGSVVLHDFFKKIGYESFENYIPHRHEEGYGLNSEAVEEFAKQNTGLLITVDCGIADVKEVTHANGLGIDVIITDHHIPPFDSAQGRPFDHAEGRQGVLPPAYAILNSKQEGDTYPDNMLCGAGVVWKLVQALILRGREEKMIDVPDGWEKWLLDMAGLATIADMVPLRNENRALAYFGLKVLRKSTRPGLLKLLRKMKVDQRHLTEDDIGFMIAPRINAASRMSVPMEAFRLLSTTDDKIADELSDHLQKMNDERKWTVGQIMKEVKHELAHREIKSVIVIGNPKWRVGVLGLAANNICEEYGRPAFVWGREGASVIKGSCRSGGSVNVVELMTSVSEELFIDMGGHEQSGGFSIANEKIHLLESELVRACERMNREEGKDERIEIDAALSLNDVNWNTHKEIEQLAPFGIGNPKPAFLFENIEIVEVSEFGKEKNHLRLGFKNSRGLAVQSIGFFMGKDSFGVPFDIGARINLVATMEKSMFRNRPELRLRIVDIAVA